MNCKRACDYIMKYLDDDLTQEEEKLLFEHLDSCHGCAGEFEELKETISMLHEVKMEDPPVGFDLKVMCRIEVELAREKALADCKKGGLLLLLSLGAWAALALLFIYTPALEIIVLRIKDFEILLGGAVKFAAFILHKVFLSIMDFLTLGKAMNVAERAILETYSGVFTAAGAVLALILMASRYMFGIIRR